MTICIHKAKEQKKVSLIQTPVIYYVFLKSYVILSLMIDGIRLQMYGYKTREVINKERLINVCIQYVYHRNH